MYGVELDIRHWMAKKKYCAYVIPVVSSGCSLSFLWCALKVQAASAQEGMLIKLKPRISLRLLQ